MICWLSSSSSSLELVYPPDNIRNSFCMLVVWGFSDVKVSLSEILGGLSIFRIKCSIEGVLLIAVAFNLTLLTQSSLVFPLY